MAKLVTTRLWLYATVVGVHCVGGVASVFATTSIAAVGVGETPNSYMTGLLILVGSQVAVTIAIASALRKWLRERTRDDITAWAYDDESPFGKHRIDADAHLLMRRQLLAEWQASIDKINEARKVEMDRFTNLMQPIIDQNGRLIDQNGRALELLSAQTRRGVRDGNAG